MSGIIRMKTNSTISQHYAEKRKDEVIEAMTFD